MFVTDKSLRREPSSVIRRLGTGDGMSACLSSGSLLRMCLGEVIREPLLQVVDWQMMHGLEVERWEEIEMFDA